jgi:phospholipid/cholesterol/gamma-HCH transport system substrate-binding protein
MRDNLAGTVWRLGIFVVVCLLGIVALFLVFAQLRFGTANVYRADFTDVTGLKEGNFVRVAGVEVGKVQSITIHPNSIVTVAFSADNTVALTEGTRVAIRWGDLIGGRYLALEEGAGSVKRLQPGQTIPTGRTEPALDLDALIGGFRPLFRALDPDQVNALSGQLIAALQGQGTTIGSLSVSRTPVKLDPLVVSCRCFGLVLARVGGGWTAVGVKVERPQRSEDERP